MDVQKIRGDFPILDGEIIYFDNAATSLTPKQVVLAEMEYYEKFNANIHRGVHELSQIASEHYESVYKKVSGLINSKPGEIAFTKNTTEGINLVASGLNFKKGDKVVVTAVEHHSNFLPWLRLKKKFNINLEILMPEPDGTINISDFEKAAKDAKLIASTHVSNVLGIIFPVHEIGRIAEENNSLFLVDAAQSIPHLKVDVKKIKCDFLAFSGHKMLGPTGVGGIYINGDVAEEIEPLELGGGTTRGVECDENLNFTGYKFKPPPLRFEAGTPPIAQVIGLGAAIDYLNEVGFDWIEKHERKLTEFTLNALDEIENVTVYGTRNRIGVISFNIKNLNPHDAASILSKENIVARSGFHCCAPLMKTLKIDKGTVRVSFYIYNTISDVEKFISVVNKIAGKFC